MIASVFHRIQTARHLLTDFCLLFFFNDTATTEIYTLSLHDALPISRSLPDCRPNHPRLPGSPGVWRTDRKSTRLNSSHVESSYAVFCLKKKNKWAAPKMGAGSRAPIHSRRVGRWQFSH